MKLIIYICVVSVGMWVCGCVHARVYACMSECIRVHACMHGVCVCACVCVVARQLTLRSRWTMLLSCKKHRPSRIWTSKWTTSFSTKDSSITHSWNSSPPAQLQHRHKWLFEHTQVVKDLYSLYGTNKTQLKYLQPWVICIQIWKWNKLCDQCRCTWTWFINSLVHFTSPIPGIKNSFPTSHPQLKEWLNSLMTN